MPLPAINNIMTNPGNPLLGDALLSHPLVTTKTVHFDAKCGNAAWIGNRFVVSPMGLCNYWYIPAVENTVSYCVVHCNGAGNAYVISDQYGGCEYHELYNAQFRQLAFLHIYRGGGQTVPYTPAAGWVLRSAKRSAHIVAQAGAVGINNWSFSLVDRSTNPPTVQSKFIGVQMQGGGLQGAVMDPVNGGLRGGQWVPGQLVVTLEDNGDAPY
jgi:hypothetical protein